MKNNDQRKKTNNIDEDKKLKIKVIIIIHKIMMITKIEQILILMTMIKLKWCVSTSIEFRIGQQFSWFVLLLNQSRFLKLNWLWRIHLIGSIFMFTCKLVLYNDINSQLNCLQTWPKHPISIPINWTQDVTALGQLILTRECQF